MDWMGKPVLKLAGIFSSKIDSEVSNMSKK